MEKFSTKKCTFSWSQDFLLSQQERLKIINEIEALEQEIQESLEFTQKIYKMKNRTGVVRIWLESDTDTDCLLTTYNDKGKNSWFMFVETPEMKVLCGLKCSKPKISYQTI
jgi:hypothetical protein